MQYETVTYEVSKGIGVLTLNRPKVLNAINQRMVQELLDVQARVKDDARVNALVVAGKGRAFCAGYDLKEADAREVRRTIQENRELLQRDLDMTMGFWHCPKPTLAAVQGHCLAGGCELALACDITLAAEDAIFGEPELRFGAGIVCMLLPWITGPKQAKEMLFTGDDRITAARALQMGLINRVVATGEVLPATLHMARQIAGMDEPAMRLTKAAVNRSYEIMGMREALQNALDLDVELTSLDTPDRARFREISRREGLAAALAWRDARFSDDRS